MTIFNFTQKIVVVLVVTTLTLTGCGLISAEAPASSKNSSVSVTRQLESDKNAAAKDEAIMNEAASVESPAPATEKMADSAGPADALSTFIDGDGKEALKTDLAPAESEAAAAMEPMVMGADSPAPSRDDAAITLERSESSAIAPQQSEPLRAGEVDDNAQWDDYLLYRRNVANLSVHDRDVSERYVVEVVDGLGQPVLGAEVRFFIPGQPRQEIYSARTYANGQVLFHPLALDEALEHVEHFQVEVQKENQQQQFTLTRLNAQAATSFTERWTATLDLRQPPAESLNLDVLFLVDATGSMADEITKIQSTIFDVSAQIDALPEQPNVRYGLVSYRDYGDSYVTRADEFTPDVRDFAQNLNTLFADGGGDYPEALNEGLHDALHAVEWRGGDTVQLVFLIADAPPHLDYDRSGQGYDYAVEMVNAAQQGIKIFPLASSGLDDQGEYVFRQLAQFTQGRFLFLTYQGEANGGTPGGDTTHHVDDYSVDNLDKLLVRLVQEELAYQNPQLAQAVQ